MEKKFLVMLKTRIRQVSGKNRCIRVTLKSGTEYFAKVLNTGSDYFVLDVRYPGGGAESIAVRFGAVAAVSLN